jgi:hypothetical protein
MTEIIPTEQDSQVLDKAELRRLMDDVNARMGFIPGPPISTEEVFARQLASGIRPEDCGASRELYRMRYGDNWEEDWPDV